MQPLCEQDLANAPTISCRAAGDCGKCLLRIEKVRNCGSWRQAFVHREGVPTTFAKATITVAEAALERDVSKCLVLHGGGGNPLCLGLCLSKVWRCAPLGSGGGSNDPMDRRRAGCDRTCTRTMRMVVSVLCTQWT